MGRQIDKRSFQENKVTPQRVSQLEARAADVSTKLPGDHTIRIDMFDRTTGNPAIITSEMALPQRGNYVQRALEYVQRLKGPLGLEATQAAEFVADSQIQKASSGAVAVHLQQQYKGIPIFQAGQTVRFDASGSELGTVGNSTTVNAEVEVKPALSAQQATLIAARYVATPGEDELAETDMFGQPLDYAQVDVTQFTPRIVSTISNLADQTTVLEAGPFGDKIKANLIWFPLNEHELRLAWEVAITMPGFVEQYRTMVDAGSGEILYCRQIVQSLTAHGNVYLVDGSQARQKVDFPKPWSNYQLPTPEDLPAEPDKWIDDNETDGNCVTSRLIGPNRTYAGRNDNNQIIFDPEDPTGDDQKVLNVFYYNCLMHDYFYLLGFREADGCFQKRSFGRGGIPGDAVNARVHSGAVFGTANMATPVDGSSPVMNMGMVLRTNRHTAFDATVVYHEYMHGVTNRLVGGALNVHALESPQSAGMGEGWGDYIACTVTDKEVVGAWVVDNENGIRQHAYDENFPDHFGMLGTGRYQQVHNIGEIWCAALMAMNRRIGKELGVQLVVDALKLSPPNPSFLNMRDSILFALDNKKAAGDLTPVTYNTARKGIWASFAKFGMGPNAQSNGAQLTGIVHDFNPPSFGDTPTPAASVSVEAENLNALQVLERFNGQLQVTNLTGISSGQLCAQYGQLKPTLGGVLAMVARIPVYGSKIASLIQFLMMVADQACPVLTAGAAPATGGSDPGGSGISSPEEKNGLRVHAGRNA